MASSYKRSIWEKREQYLIDRDTMSAEDLEIISIIQTIESAKKRTPSIPIEAMLKLHENCMALEDNLTISSAEFKSFLSQNDILGAGIKTIICILAVLTNGKFPPLDIKIASAAKQKGYITEQEEKNLKDKWDQMILLLTDLIKSVLTPLNFLFLFWSVKYIQEPLANVTSN